jgi:hypothetical protein
LGSGAEESDFDVLVTKDLGILVNRIPCWLTNACAIVLQGVDDFNAPASIDVDFVPEVKYKYKNLAAIKLLETHLNPMKRRGL